MMSFRSAAILLFYFFLLQLWQRCSADNSIKNNGDEVFFSFRGFFDLARLSFRLVCQFIYFTLRFCINKSAFAVPVGFVLLKSGGYVCLASGAAHVIVKLFSSVVLNIVIVISVITSIFTVLSIMLITIARSSSQFDIFQ